MHCLQRVLGRLPGRVNGVHGDEQCSVRLRAGLHDEQRHVRRKRLRCWLNLQLYWCLAVHSMLGVHGK